MKKVEDSREAASQSTDGVEVNADAVRAQVERIVANPLFHSSKRYTDLLRYIVDRTLVGQHDDLKERIIGIEVFRRAPDYDTSFDPTVRVAATEVRKRLALYYGEAGHDRELRIVVPVGSYRAEFGLPEQKLLPPTILPVPQRRKLQFWFIVAPLAVAILAFAGWGVKRLLVPVPAIDKFWAPFLASNGPVVISVGPPPKSAVLPARPTDANGSGTPDTPISEPPGGDEQIAVKDISAADDLVTYLRRNGKDSVVRPASDTSLSDLRSNPLVILGLFDNEWVRRLEDDLRFRIRGDANVGKQWIEDATNPTNKQWSVNMSPTPYDDRETDYALISRVQDLSTGKWWIGIAGLTGRGTQVAHEIVIDPKQMAAVSAGFPKDWERKNLQIVLAVKKVPDSPGTFRLLTTYFW